MAKQTPANSTTVSCIPNNNADTARSTGTSLAPRPDAEARIREAAARFHGVVTRRQLAAAGLPLHVIDYRLKTRRLIPLFEGVYRVGPLPSQREREAAAVLTCGADALLSHDTAARLLGWAPQPADAPIHISAPTRYKRPGTALRMHRVKWIHPDDATVLEGMPITTPARTIVDMAGSIDARRLERMMARADRDGLADQTAIQSAISRMPRRPGAAQLRALIGAPTDPALTRSEAESSFLSLVRRGRLPEPRMNVRACGFEVDALWRGERLVVEIDGFAFHSSRQSFEQDRLRDSQLATQGYRVMRITWRQLQDEPEAVLVRVALALSRHATESPYPTVWR